MFETIQDRLRWARSRATLSYAQASERTGINAKTVQSHETGHRAKGGLKDRYVQAYSRAYGVDEAWLATGIGEPEKTARGRDIRVRVRGILQAGAWTEHFEWSDSHAYDVWIRGDDDLIGEVLYAAEVQGTSMNRVYPEGTIVVLRRRIDGVRDLQPGKRYHIERTAPDGLVENTLKTVRVRGDGSIWLVPESDDPEFEASIRVSPRDEISFVGRVVRAIVKD